MSDRGERGHFGKGHRLGGRPPGIADRRTLEARDTCQRILAGIDLEGILEKLTRDRSKKIRLDTLKLILSYAWGLPRQTIDLEGGGLDIVVRRAALPDGHVPDSPSGAARDSEPPGEVPGGGGGPAVGKEPHGE